MKIFQDYKWLIVLSMHTLGSILDRAILMRPWTLSSSKPFDVCLSISLSVILILKWKSTFVHSKLFLRNQWIFHLGLEQQADTDEPELNLIVTSNH